MEVTFAWFWIIKLVFLSLSIFLIYKFVQTIEKEKKLTNKWLWFAIVLGLLQSINPIKINGTNSTTAIKQRNLNIEMSNRLPEKVEDNTFTENSKSIKTITDFEIWSTK